MKNVTREELENILKQALAKSPEVQFAYVFGSWATGWQRRDSDVDVAVWLNLADRRARYDLGMKIMGEIMRAAGTDWVDVVVLNDATLSLRYVVQRQGILLSEKDREARVKFEVMARNDYWDFEPILTQYWKSLKKEMLEGRLGA